MSGPLDLAVIAGVCALVLARQLKAQKVVSDAKGWAILPAVLIFMSVREPGLIDPDHRAVSVALLAAGTLAGLATGAGWAWTTRIWADASGAVWAKGNGATAAIWLGGVALRLGLSGLGALAGVHQGGPATMLMMAATLLARTGVVVYRAQDIRPAYRVPAGG
ncbi:DUF1453 domain-containing protein [Streptomyces sp. NPDC026206]|uniref:DUF1453 domain-containing protein n=1 Tax=Streptomyces sp. NPDC026206 TaxID=3157089 RepID=UPI0033E436ED